MFAGLRRGECCGLRWRDIDSDVLHVRQSVGLGGGNGSTAYVKATKTEHDRDIPLSPMLAAYLEALPRVGPYVIAGTRTPYLSPAMLTRNWSAFARATDVRGSEGRRATFHDLRHTFATSLVRVTDPVTAARLLGHASPKMTLDVYAATDTQTMRAAIDALSTL